MTNSAVASTSTSLSELVDRYIATWNERDAGRRAELVARTFTPSARYVDPLAAASGHAAISQLIGAVHGQFPDFTFTRRGAADGHGAFARFAWSLGPVGGPPVAGGTDLAVIDNGRLASVTGFLDAVPAAPAMIPTRDGEQLAFTDTGGAGAPVVFVASWALHGAMWRYQLAALRDAGARCITFDRRGHGRSTAGIAGLDFDLLADDLAAVLDTLDLRGVTLVGHSSGCMEIVRYLARHGSARVARVALIAPVTPSVQQSADNPAGRTLAFAEESRAAWARDFAGWVDANKAAFFCPDTDPAIVAWLVDMINQIPVDVAIAMDRALFATDVRADLAKIDRPTLVIHGDRDVSAPLVLGQLTAAGIPGAKLSVYPGAAHGVFATHIERVNAELRAFIAGR
jgi:pimeloyl-ACP methyl ester carboxylesterase